VIATSSANHLNRHRRSGTGLECRFGDCGKVDDGVIFQSSGELITHFFKEHKFLCTLGVGHRRAEVFVWWCSSCFAWINGHQEDLIQHAERHIPLINDIVHHEGYTGLKVYDLNFRPLFCPFCLHDGALSATIRFKDFCCTGPVGYAQHVLAHIKALSDEKSICPASISEAGGIMSNCSCLEPMDAKQLQVHLEEQHELELSGKEKMRDEAETDAAMEVPTKKPKNKNIGRRIALEPKSVNAKISKDIKTGRKALASVE